MMNFAFKLQALPALSRKVTVLQPTSNKSITEGVNPLETSPLLRMGEGTVLSLSVHTSTGGGYPIPGLGGGYPIPGPGGGYPIPGPGGGPPHQD